MTRHTELACDRLFGKQQELEIYGGKKELEIYGKSCMFFTMIGVLR